LLLLLLFRTRESGKATDKAYSLLVLILFGESDKATQSQEEKCKDEVTRQPTNRRLNSLSLSLVSFFLLLVLLNSRNLFLTLSLPCFLIHYFDPPSDKALSKCDKAATHWKSHCWGSNSASKILGERVKSLCESPE
jgi:hypothetical protein